MEKDTFLWDVLELACELRKERLFVLSEQNNLRNLNEKVIVSSARLTQLLWVAAQQRLNLHQLILSRPDISPPACCQRATQLDQAEFIEAYKVLGYQESQQLGQLLEVLRSSPELLGWALFVGDQIAAEKLTAVVNSVICGIYGSCLLPQDKLLVLRLLKHLTVLQIVPNENPSRLIRNSTCAFSRVYSTFLECLFPAKLFLTAALRQPIMELLMEEERFLDYDLSVIPARFSKEERLRRFGPETSTDFSSKLQEYRSQIIATLSEITKRFITNIRDNLYIFPPDICWLVRQMFAFLSSSGKFSEKCVFAICVDVIFTHFICPAIVNPEPYGITDTPISSVARYNLIQVAQILQVLALRNYEEVDPKVEDLYSQFEKNSVSSILNDMLEGARDNLSEEPTIDTNKLPGFSRTDVLFTEQELFNFIQFLQTISTQEGRDEELRKELSNLLSQLPTLVPTQRVRPQSVPVKRNGILSKGKSLVSSKLSVVPVNIGAGDSNEDTGSAEEDEKSFGPVLLIPFEVLSESKIGLLSEQKVLLLEKERGLKSAQIRDEAAKEETIEKRTRFSLSHDEGSIGNTSDNLEVVSEAASNHSVASSLELEQDQNDNLSDMISANVSGRGTPNISGRDTPSSQIIEGEEAHSVSGAGGGGARPPSDYTPTSAPSTVKPSRFDFDDKFGKFEIKTLLDGSTGADETVSMISDTWSTDVLASDSELVEQSSERNFPRVDLESQSLLSAQLIEASETASEAWSTDVVASDSERMTEVDTDDTCSVARSDDTARSEVESRGDPDEMPSSGGSSFRPVAPEPLVTSSRLSVPQSPTRIDVSSNRNTTRVDYRRRTLEFVDTTRHNHPYHSRPSFVAANQNENANKLIHVIDKMEKLCDPKPVPLTSVSEPVHTSSTSVNSTSPVLAGPTLIQGGSGGQASSLLPTSLFKAPNCSSNSSANLPQAQSGETQAVPASSGNVISLKTNHQAYRSQTSSSQDVSIDDPESTGVCVSTTSLASTSSSGSSTGNRPKMHNDLCASRPSPVPNGSILTMDERTSTKEVTPKATGAIPRSISFDKTAERGDKDLDDDSKHKRGSFFQKFRLPFKNRRGKGFRGGIEETSICNFDGNTTAIIEGENLVRVRLRRGAPEDIKSTQNDTSEDILAKYRSKSSNLQDAASEGASSKSGGSINRFQSIERSGSEDEGTNPDSDLSIFDDTKKKLRFVLSSAEIQYLPWNNEHNIPVIRNAWSCKDNELVGFLQLQLAEALNLQDRSLIAHLHETLRRLRLFDGDGCRKLYSALKEDYALRAQYIDYLVHSRQFLLSSLAYLERLMNRVRTDQELCCNYLLSVCVRLFLERRDDLLSRFVTEFQQLTLADEKNDLLNDFLENIAVQMEADPTWQVASESQISAAKIVVERAVISRVYSHAMYPNGDGDIFRDQVLHEHIKKLAKVITPSHKDLRIPKIFHTECPWPSAQAELSAISAYKTPKDKLQCVFRTATTIMNLLSLSCESGAPAADDTIPVLVFVLIKTNPPSLLSTVQYVNSFYGNRLEGEEQYWWVQFCSAVEFIKTMDYSD